MFSTRLYRSPTPSLSHRSPRCTSFSFPYSCLTRLTGLLFPAQLQLRILYSAFCSSDARSRTPSARTSTICRSRRTTRRWRPRWTLSPATASAGMLNGSNRWRTVCSGPFPSQATRFGWTAARIGFARPSSTRWKPTMRARYGRKKSCCIPMPLMRRRCTASPW